MEGRSESQFGVPRLSYFPLFSPSGVQYSRIEGLPSRGETPLFEDNPQKLTRTPPSPSHPHHSPSFQVGRRQLEQTPVH